MANPLMLKVVVDDKGNPVLKDMQTNITKLNSRTKGLGKTLTHVFHSAVMLQGLMAFRNSISSINHELFQFNKIMKQTEGITRTVGKPLDLLKSKIFDVSNVTEHTSSNLATAVLNISKMGFNLQQSLEVIPHLANLATSSTSELEEVTQIAVQTMKSFQMEATDMEHIVNVIQGTVSSTAIGFLDFAESMKFVAPIAKTMNISLEETAAMIGILGDIGIKGSLGGTTLKNMFLNIMQPSDKVRGVLEGLNEEGLTFTKILKAMDESGVGVKDFLLTFNKRAVAGSLALSQLTEKTDELEKALVNDAIKASEVADTIREAWIPQLQILKNTFINTFVLMGEILDQSDIGLGIHGITEEFINLQNWLRENPEQLERFASELADIAKVLGTNIAKGLTFFVKNLDLLKGAAKAFIALKLADNLFLTANNMRASAKATKGFMGAVNTYGATSLNYLTGVLIAAQGIASIITMYQDNQLDEKDRRADAAFGESEKQIKLQMKVLREFKDMWVNNAQIILNAKRRLKDEDDKLTKAQKQNLQDIIATSEMMIKRGARISLAEKYGFAIEFFEPIKSVDKLNTFLGVLDKKLLAITNKKKGIQDINDLFGNFEKFKMPELKDKAGAGRGRSEGFDWEAWWNRPQLEFEMDGVIKEINRLKSSLSMEQMPPIPSLEAFRKVNVVTQTTGMGVNTGVLFGEEEKKGLFGSESSKIILDQYDAVVQEISNKKKKLGEESSAFLENLYNEQAKSYIESEQAKFDEARRLEEEMREYRWDQTDQYIESAAMTVDMIQMIQDAGFERSKARMEKELQYFEDKSKRELAAVQGNAFKTQIVEKKLAKEKARLMKEQEKLEKEQLNKRRVWSIIEVAINTAVGVSAALRGTPPASYVMAALTAALGAAQIGLIAAQDSYRKGGPTGSGFDHEVAGTVHKNEYVIDANNLRLLGGADNVDQMIDNRINDNLGSRGSQFNIQVDTLIGEEEWIDKTAVKIQRSLQRQIA